MGPQPDKSASQVAEEILRTIYGDDFTGCTVSLETVAGIVRDGAQQHEGQTRELMDLYDKLVEAIHLLSTPPGATEVTDPDALRTLLSERLDAIHVLTSKTIETTALVKRQRGDGIEE